MGWTCSTLGRHDIQNFIQKISRMRPRVITRRIIILQDWKSVLFSYTQFTQVFFMPHHWRWRQQVASFTSMSQRNCGVTSLLLERNNKCDNGIQSHCCYNVIRSHCCEPTQTSVTTVATMWPNYDHVSHCCINAFQQWHHSHFCSNVIQWWPWLTLLRQYGAPVAQSV
jgi:hypothetical protein